MLANMLQFLQNLFRSNWKRQVGYDRGYNKKRRKSGTCVLKSVSSKSSMSAASGCALASQHTACSIDSINFEFCHPKETNVDLCCLRKCCEKCFCEEGEAIAESVRKCRAKKRVKAHKVFLRCQGKKPETHNCHCISRCSISASRGSMDSACDVSSTSSCENEDCEYREQEDSGVGGINVHTFANIHAVASNCADYSTLTPPYENVPELTTFVPTKEPLYDSVPPRPPRAVSEPSYENVLSINCIDNCVFRQITCLIDTAQTPAQMVQSLQDLHKDYSCVRSPSSADNEINYFYESFDEYENDLNTEIERRMSD